VSDYTAGWPDLPGVKEDMQDLQVALERNGFNVTVVADPEGPELRRAFDRFIREHGRDPENRLLFYFSGHGHTMPLSYGENMGYLVPSNATDPRTDRDGFLDQALDMEMIEVYAKRIQSKHALFLFDSCFSGQLFALSRAIPTDISQQTTAPVRQFITAGSADETVPDQSIFREQFVAGLEGEADANGDGFVTGTELGLFLYSTVSNYSKGTQTPQYGKIRNRNLDKGDFVFHVQEQLLPSQTAIALPPQNDFSLADLQDRRAEQETRRQQQEQLRKEWDSYQQRMAAAFSETQKFVESSTELSLRNAAWTRFLTAFASDNPYSEQDEQLREQATAAQKAALAPASLSSPPNGSEEKNTFPSFPRLPEDSSRDQEVRIARATAPSTSGATSDLRWTKQVIVDLRNDLTWERNPVQRVWSVAREDCAQKQLEEMNDWRLPSKREMESFALNLKRSGKLRELFADDDLGLYWTNTPYSGYNGGGVWGVHLASRMSSGLNLEEPRSVICVRSGVVESDVIAETANGVDDDKKPAWEVYGAFSSEKNETTNAVGDDKPAQPMLREEYARLVEQSRDTAGCSFLHFGCEDPLVFPEYNSRFHLRGYQRVKVYGSSYPWTETNLTVTPDDQIFIFATGEVSTCSHSKCRRRGPQPISNQNVHIRYGVEGAGRNLWFRLEKGGYAAKLRQRSWEQGQLSFAVVDGAYPPPRDYYDDNTGSYLLDVFVIGEGEEHQRRFDVFRKALLRANPEDVNVRAYFWLN
jgi:hypothetical protein